MVSTGSNEIQCLFQEPLVGARVGHTLTSLLDPNRFGSSKGLMRIGLGTSKSAMEHCTMLEETPSRSRTLDVRKANSPPRPACPHIRYPMGEGRAEGELAGRFAVRLRSRFFHRFANRLLELLDAFIEGGGDG